MEYSPSVWASMASGAIAGLGVDVVLFPLDTIKTRLQSSQGFKSSGGFARPFSGLGPVAIGSTPCAAMFFLVYESGKRHLCTTNVPAPLIHMMSAALGETAACLIRVPVEIVKQRRQVDHRMSSIYILKNAFKAEGPKGLYRGTISTIMRDVPFTLLQFPLWEWLKSTWAKKLKRKKVNAWQSGMCGAIAAAASGAVTTPFDVAKTRIMLADAQSQLAKKQSTFYAMKCVYGSQGWGGLFSGLLPRVAWISVGGALFLGIYDGCLLLLTS